MMDVGQGVTKEGPTYQIYIYMYISIVQLITAYVGLTQAQPCTQSQQKLYVGRSACK